MTPPVIHWFRRDLRLGDNTALNAALETGQPVIPLFILDEAIYKGERASVNRTAFLLAGLRALDAELRGHGSRLLVRAGEPLAVLRAVINETGVTALTFNRDYSPYARRRDKQIYEVLGSHFTVHSSEFEDTHAELRTENRELNRGVITSHDLLLHPPTSIMTDGGKPYTVYTPFKRRWLDKAKLPTHTAKGTFAPLDGIDGMVIPQPCELGIGAHVDLPPAGEAAALKRLRRWVANGIDIYDETRNHLFANPWTDEVQGTSVLSPYLRLGMLSPRQAYQAAMKVRTGTRKLDKRDAVDVWISELAWREFYTHILYHFPHVYNHNFKREYDELEWRDAPDELAAWQAGQTGYPIVDAAMRQLAQYGWMHNRARMIVSSFLTKDLLIHWREGDVHFMHHLLDGDLAANNGGWQWAAGTGTDAQPYFRIFNPVSQSQKFDPNGDYIRALVPELRDVPTQHIHAPWEMDTPPVGYAERIVDHAMARERTLAAFKAARPQKEEEDEPQKRKGRKGRELEHGGTEGTEIDGGGSG
jgi:deoxyribodipyrimidine photo-lyase